MKTLKLLSFVLLIVLAILFILPAFINGNYVVERKVTIKMPKDDVFYYIKHLKSQDDINVWTQMDPDIEKSYSGKDGTVGASFCWKGNKIVGCGRQEITAIEEGKRVDSELQFTAPFKSTNKAWIITESIDKNTTLVKWGFEGKINYPMKGMLIFRDMEETLGPPMQKGLNNLKTLLEAK